MPPGFERGMTFDPAVRGPPISEGAEPPTTVNISELLLGGGEMVMGWGGEGEEEKKEEEGEGGEISDEISPQQASLVSIVLCLATYMTPAAVVKSN